MNGSMAAAAVEPGRDRGEVWAIVLAGGEGTRLRSLTRYVCGDDRPKQYATLVGARSLLQLTLDRVAMDIAPERTVVVVRRDHAEYLGDVAGGPWRLLAQPQDRGTAVAILWAAHWISWRDPGATVAVFPSDHFVLGAKALMDHAMAAGSFVDRHPDVGVLLGARAADPEVGYGWIERGPRIGVVASEPAWQVRRFLEKPTPQVARECWARGDLWNTFILVATAAWLIELGCEALPTASDGLAAMEPLTGTRAESRAMERAFALLPGADFSRAIAQLYPARFAVSPLPARVTWSDWGTPARVVQSLHAVGVSPHWLDRLEQRRAVPA